MKMKIAYMGDMQIVPLSEHRPYTQSSSSFDNVISIIVLYCYRHLLEVKKESLFYCTISVAIRRLYLYLNIAHTRNLHLDSITLFLYCDRIFVRSRKRELILLYD